MTEPIKRRIDPVEAVRFHVPREFGVPWAMIRRRQRSPAAVAARLAAIVLLQRCARLPSPRIGALLNLDASTVRHATRRAEHRMQTEPGFAAQIEAIHANVTEAASVAVRKRRIVEFWTPERDTLLRQAWTETVAPEPQIATLLGCEVAEIVRRATALGLMSDEYPIAEARLRATIHAAEQAAHDENRGN